MKFPLVNLNDFYFFKRKSFILAKKFKMKGKQKERQILESGKSLFFRHGIRRISVEEICHQAQVSKATFYKYFENKEDLIMHIRRELLESGFAAFDAISERDLPFPEKIREMTRWQLEFFAKMKNEFIQEIASISDLEEEYKKRFIQNLKSAQAKGEIRSELNLDLIYLITRKLQEITLDGSWKSITEDYGEYIEQVRTVIFFGMLSRTEKV